MICGSWPVRPAANTGNGRNSRSHSNAIHGSRGTIVQSSKGDSCVACLVDIIYGARKRGKYWR